MGIRDLVQFREYGWVSLGGVVGACSRYYLSRLASKVLSPSFPWGTLLINVTGSFILGLFLVYSTERVLVDPRWRLLVAIGFCGAFTTFSSYAYETMMYYEQGHWSMLIANMAGNNLLCLLAVVGGAALARAL